MSLPYETLLETGREDLIVKPDEVLRVVAQAGASYRVVQGQERELVTDVVVVRDGANLILHFADGAKVVIEEYFTLCERGDCDVTLPKDGAPSSEAMKQALASETKEGHGEEGHSNVEQNAQIVYVEGDPGRVMDILKGEPALSNALATVDSEESDGDEGLLYWSLIGVGIAYGAYEVFLDDGASTPLPVFSDGESVTATIEENSATETVIFDADASDPADMVSGNGITYSLAGDDAGAFTIDPATGEVRLNAIADFESQASYDLEIVATSNLTMAQSRQTLSVAVTDVPLSIEGIFVAGPVIPGHGLIATAFTTDGTELGSAELNDDGTFTIDANPDDYDGLVLVRVHDESTGPDYAHEGSGSNEDLTIDLRAIGRVGEEGVIRVNVNLLSEIAVQQLLADMGGDAGSSGTVLGSAITETQATAQYASVLRALGLDPAIDLGETDPHPVNAQGFSDASPEAQALGQILAVVAAAETSLGTSSAEVLQRLVEGTQEGALDQALLDDLVTAATLADSVAGNAGGTAAFLMGLAGAGIDSIAISDDSGSSATDFLTNVAAQTISITLIAALAADQAVYGSVDNGQTWVDIAGASGSSVSGTNVSWVTSLSAADPQRIVVVVTEDGESPANDGSNIVGRSLGQPYVLDTTAPEITVTSLTAAENSTAVDDVEAPDENGIAATGGYTLGGADASLFSITNDGVLSFAANQDFEAPSDANGDGIYNLDITVADAAGNTATQAVTVNLQNVNEAPVAVSGSEIPDSTAVTDQPFSIAASVVAGAFSDPDSGDTLTYSATGLPSGLSINATTGEISGTATADLAATDIVVTATDAGGLTVTDTFSLTVVSAPTISSIALNGGAVVAQSGGSHTFDVTFSESVTVAGGTPTLTLDINGTPTTATYAAGSGTNTLTFTITGPAADGDAVEITAINLAGATVTGGVSNQGLVTTVVGQTTNDLTIDDTGPTVTTTSLDADENGTAVGSIAATDTNGIAATGGYTLAGPDVALFSITDAGVLSFTGNQDYEAPSDGDNDGIYNIDVTVTDTAGNDTTQSVTVNLQNVNEAPTVVSGSEIPDSTAVTGQSFSIAASVVAGAFSDPDSGDTLTYSATGLPSGLSINATTGAITGTAATAAAATNIVVTATDAGGLTVTDTFALAVVSAPTVSSTVDGVTNLDVRSPIVLTFSDDVTAATGNIVITDLNTSGVGWKNDNTDNTQTIDVTDVSQVTISDNIVTINPDFDFDFGTDYEITFAAGVFTGDTSGEGSIAVTSGDLTFTTVTPATDAVGQLSQIQVAGTDALVASNYWIDGHQSDPTAGAIQVDASASDIAVAFSLQNNGFVNEDGHIQLNGVTDLNDVIYGDDPNSGLIPNPNRDFGWSNGGKTIGNDSGGFGGRTVVDAQTSNPLLFDDASLSSFDAGTVIYG